jgi:predicted transcriptional regulator of viral defense system
MNKTEIVKNIIKNNDGIAKTADFIAEGLTNYDVANLCKDGYLKRIRHGYYQLAAQKYLKEEQMLASLLPESIVCVESALFYYGYSDFSPRQWSIAVPRTLILLPQKYIISSLICLKSEKQAVILTACSLLSMIGNAPSVTASNTAQNWTTKCLTKRLMPMPLIKRKT